MRRYEIEVVAWEYWKWVALLEVLCISNGGCDGDMTRQDLVLACPRLRQASRICRFGPSPGRCGISVLIR
jgi:hypothetical protein